MFCLFPKHLRGTKFKSKGLVYLKEEMSNSQIPRLWSGYFSLLLVRLYTKNLEGGKGEENYVKMVCLERKEWLHWMLLRMGSKFK